MAGRGWFGSAFVLVMIVGGTAAPAAAQTSSDEEGALSASWSFRVGAARYGLSDGLASPLPHRGTGMVLGAGYGLPGHHGGWGVTVSYWAPRVSSGIQTAGGGFETTHQADLGFVWLKRIADLRDGGVGLHLGGALDARFSFRSHRYRAWGLDSKVERFGDLFLPLQVAGMWSVRLGEGALLTHRLAVPGLTLAFRSPYTGLKYFPEATLEGPFSVTGLDSRLAYRRKAGRGWLVGVFHHMTLMHYPDPRPLSSVVHRVGLEVVR